MFFLPLGDSVVTLQGYRQVGLSGRVNLSLCRIEPEILCSSSRLPERLWHYHGRLPAVLESVS